MSMKPTKTHPLPYSPALRASALSPIQRYFANEEGKLATLFRRRGLDLRTMSDPYEAVKLSTYLQIFEDAAAIANDTLLGAQLGAKIGPSDLGPTGFLLLQSETIEKGLRRFADGVSALQSATDITVGAYGEDLLSINYHIQAPHLRGYAQDAEFSISCICQLIKIGFSRDWRPREVHFIHDGSERSHLLEAFFNAPVRFNRSTNRLILDARAANIVHRSEDFTLISLIERHVADLVLTQDPDVDVVERVQSVISRNLGAADVNLANVASELNMSVRSLQRQLAAQNTSLRNEVEIFRRFAAEDYLADGKRSIAAIAVLLGYSDQTAFWRAYRKWNGVPPSGVTKPSVHRPSPPDCSVPCGIDDRGRA